MALQGSLQVAGDKSITHRGIILSSLAKGVTVIEDPLLGEDCLSTLNLFEQLGVNYEITDRQLRIESPGMDHFLTHKLVVNANNSGTTARLLMGVLAGLPLNVTLLGDESLSKRPMGRVKDPLTLMGADIELTPEKTLPAIIRGQSLQGIEYELPMASAQVKSAILFAGMLASKTTVIHEPIPTRDHTEKMFESFSIKLEKENRRLTMPGLQRPQTPGNIQVPADISSAAFFIVAALITPGSDITLRRVGLNKTRAGIIEVVQQMKGRLTIFNETMFGGELVGDLRVQFTKELEAVIIGGELIPRLIDEVPIIALLATQARGTTVIQDAQELKVKESDRIATTVTELTKLGFSLTATDDGMKIQGQQPRKPMASKVSSHHDHRIAMMLCVATLLGEVAIEGIEAMNVSYPDFLKHLRQLEVLG